MLFFWYLSFFVAMLTFVLSFAFRSWKLMLLSTLTSLPIAYYFFEALNGWRLVAFVPIVLLMLTIVLWRRNKAPRWS